SFYVHSVPWCMTATLVPYTTLFRSPAVGARGRGPDPARSAVRARDRPARGRRVRARADPKGLPGGRRRLASDGHEPVAGRGDPEAAPDPHAAHHGNRHRRGARTRGAQGPGAAPGDEGAGARCRPRAGGLHGRREVPRDGGRVAAGPRRDRSDRLDRGGVGAAAARSAGGAPARSQQAGEVPGGLSGREARGGEGGGGEAVAVNFVPHVVAWNLTRRCNLECAHCYIAAGPRESAVSELETAQCLRIVDELVALNPAPLLILSGGEPLLRDDLTDIARYASQRGATVVVGTNGTLLTDGRIAALERAGVRGVAVSVDSLRPSYHDNFRHGAGSLAATQAALGRLRAARRGFAIQPS